ncbi:hypothetical protein LQZ19_08560 [Treponema primitia]|uniref:hypothetical protein n=1 Tax=Treponema primitia TaxID=88058 RepID=UPI0039816914
MGNSPGTKRQKKYKRANHHRIPPSTGIQPPESAFRLATEAEWREAYREAYLARSGGAEKAEGTSEEAGIGTYRYIDARNPEEVSSYEKHRQAYWDAIKKDYLARSGGPESMAERQTPGEAEGAPAGAEAQPPQSKHPGPGTPGKMAVNPDRCHDCLDITGPISCQSGPCPYIDTRPDFVDKSVSRMLAALRSRGVEAAQK